MLYNLHTTWTYCHKISMSLDCYRKPSEAIHLGWMNMWRRLWNSGLCSSPRNSFQMLYADSATMWLLSKFLWWSFVIVHGFQLYILHENMVTSPGYLLLNRAEDCLHFNSCNYLHTKMFYLLPKHHGHFLQLYTLLFLLKVRNTTHSFGEEITSLLYIRPL